MFCPNCGAELADGAKFCPKCGSQLNDAEDQSANGGPEEKPVRKKHTGRIIAIILAAVVVIAAVIVIIIVTGHGNNEKIVKTRTGISDNGSVEEYTYDRDGNILTATYFDEDGTVSSRYTYTYNSKGDKLTESDDDEGGSFSISYQYTYDSDGNMLTEAEYDSNNNIYTQAEYTYDENGNILTYKNYDSNGDMINDNEYVYDSDGKIIYIRTIVDSGFYLRSETDSDLYWEYEYDTNGNYTIRGYRHYENSLLAYLEFNMNGELILLTEYSDKGEITYSLECTYNKYGNVLTTILHSYDDDVTESIETITYEYEYYD